MFEAVDSIGQDLYELGNRLESSALKAFSQLIMGEIASQEHIGDPFKAEVGLQQLLEANQLYVEDASSLSTAEYSRLCIALVTFYREYKQDVSQAKRWLELAREKITDRKVLLKFYSEMAQLLENEGKKYQALDSYK